MQIISEKIEIETHITYEIYWKSHMFSLFRGKLYKQGPILFFSVAIFGILVSLITGFSFGFDTIIIILLSILTLLSILMLFSIFVVPRLYYKSARKLIEVTTKYLFQQDYMEVEVDSDLLGGSSKIKYNALYGVYEIDDMLFILLSNKQAYIIPKDSCSAVSMNNLRMILKSSVKKYKNYSN